MDFFQDTGGRLLVILLTIPLWWPVMRALWEEINWMLREEGGVFGPIPSERDRASMLDQKSTRLNSSHVVTSYAVFRLKKKNT